MASILKVDTIQDQSGNNIINENADTITIGASGDTITVPTGASLTVPSGGLSGQNYPAFEAYLSASQSVTHNSTTKAQCNTEVFDTDSCYDNASNYRFTPTVAGKYFVYGSIGCSAGSNGDNLISIMEIRKNGGGLAPIYVQHDNRNGGSGNTQVIHGTGVIDFNGSSDYIELYGAVYPVSSGNEVFSGNATLRYTKFGAYRIGD